MSAARPDGAVGIESSRVARTNDGSIELYVSKGLSPGNWLEIAGDGPFWLVLTLYDTTLFSGLGSSQTAMPSITREGC